MLVLRTEGRPCVEVIVMNVKLGCCGENDGDAGREVNVRMVMMVVVEL